MSTARVASEQQATLSVNDGAPPPSGSQLPSSDDGLCPILSDGLWRYFDGVATPRRLFNAKTPSGAVFRDTMRRLPVERKLSELLTGPPTVGNIEDQLQHARGTSRHGLDGVGYDIYQLFYSELLSVLMATFTCGWKYKLAPQS